jgi:hypothetical protein
MTSQNNHFLKNAIVSTGSDITDKVEIKEGILKTARLFIAKDILCSMISSGSFCGVEGMREYILDSYAIADILIKEGGL